MDTALVIVLEPIELCSGDARIFLDLSRLGMVCLNTLLEGDLKKALSQRLLAWLLARAVSDTVWNSVLPLYLNLELRPSSENFLPAVLGLWRRKKE